MVDLQRRALIAGAAATVAALRLGASALASPAVRRAPLPADPFTLGVASGDPAADGFVLWTRLAPDPLNGGGMPPDPVAVTWEVASDPLFATVEASGSLNAVADLAHTAHVEVDGLLPDASYWYRFSVEGWVSPVGRARHARGGFARRPCASGSCRARATPAATTRPWPGSPRRSATCGCTWATTSTRTPGAVRPARTVPTSASRSSSTEPATRSTRPIPTLQAAHHAAPVVPVWDDHEVDNNYTVVDDARRTAGYRAWFEHLPVRLTGARRPGPTDLPAPRMGGPRRVPHDRRAPVP